MGHYFPSCFFRYHRLHNFDVVSVVRFRFCASRQDFAHLAISDEALRTHRVCNLCEEMFVGETLLPSSKFFLQRAVSWCPLKFTEYYFAGAHGQTVHEPTPEMTHFIFSESECFRRKTEYWCNEIFLKWLLFSNKTVSPSTKTEAIYLQSKEREIKKGFSFNFLHILVKHLKFEARFSNPWWFVRGRYLLTPSYIWLSVKTVYCSIFPSSIMHG